MAISCKDQGPPPSRVQVHRALCAGGGGGGGGLGPRGWTGPPSAVAPTLSKTVLRRRWRAGLSRPPRHRRYGDAAPLCRSLRRKFRRAHGDGRAAGSAGGERAGAGGDGRRLRRPIIGRGGWWLSGALYYVCFRHGGGLARGGEREGHSQGLLAPALVRSRRAGACSVKCVVV